MRGIRGKRVRVVKEGTLIATVDIGMTTNTGYCTTIDGREERQRGIGHWLSVAAIGPKGVGRTSLRKMA